MYYYDKENKKVLRYYASLNGKLFKTEDEYLDYVKKNKLKREEVKYFKKSKYHINANNELQGKWETKNIVPGTILFDERDYSRYTFEDEAEVEEFFDFIKNTPDAFIQQCYYDGYEGEGNEGSLQTQVNEVVAQSAVAIGDEYDETLEHSSFAHFIISYLPDDEALRETRKQAMRNLICNIKEITPGARIYINAQNYKEDELIIDGQVSYLYIHEEGIGAQRARNELLEYFYNSSYEYGILHDDDSFLNPTDSAKDFFDELAKTPQKFARIPIDVCYARNMLFAPHIERDVAKAGFRSKNWEFLASPSSWLSWATVRNFKLAYNEEYYFDETIDPKNGDGYDDTDWCYRVASKRFSWTLPQLELLLQLQGEEYSSIYNDLGSPMYRIHSLKATRDKYLPLTKSQTAWNYSALRRKIKQPKSWAVPRVVERDLNEDLDKDKKIVGLRVSRQRKEEKKQSRKINKGRVYYKNKHHLKDDEDEGL